MPCGQSKGDIGLRRTLHRAVPAAAFFLIVASVANAQERSIARGSVFGCQSWDTYKTIVEYAADNDKEAFNRAYANAMISGECTDFKIGEAVYVVDTGLISVKQRRKGDTIGYWTTIQVIYTLLN
jgi:hypothetical protein